MIWAVAFAVFSFGGFAPFQDFAPSSLLWVPYALLYGGVGWGAGLATAWIFKNARKTIALRSVVGRSQGDGGGRRRREWALMWVWAIAFYVIAFAAFTHFQSVAFPILYATTSFVEIFIYYSLRLSFPDEIPAEGKLALESYGVCVVLSFFVSLLLPQYLTVLLVAWATVSALWLFCAFYALRHAPEDLVELRC